MFLITEQLQYTSTTHLFDLLVGSLSKYFNITKSVLGLKLFCLSSLTPDNWQPFRLNQMNCSAPSFG